VTLPISAEAGAANQALSAAYLELKALSGTEPYKLAVQWLRALIVAQQSHMATCNPARLEAAQVRTKLLVALHQSLAAPGGASTGHVFD